MYIGPLGFPEPRSALNCNLHELWSSCVDVPETEPQSGGWGSVGGGGRGGGGGSGVVVVVVVVVGG